MNQEEWTVGKLLGKSGGFWEAFAIHAGVKLDIFTFIGVESLTAEEVAKNLAGEVRGVSAFLNALSAMGLLSKENGKFSNTPWSKSLLVKNSPQYVGYMIMHHANMVLPWHGLDKAVKSGRPVREGPPNEQERESFLMGMFNGAMAIALGLAKELDLSDREHLLDLGGGPGTYAIHFCMENPKLKATVYDLPTTEPFALKTIERFGQRSRIDFIGGDYTKDDVPGSYDVAWLSHILHSLGPGECEAVIKKAVSALNPGGVILVHDFLLTETVDAPLFPALFSLNMLVNTENGQSYSEEEVRGMLSRAGAKDIRRMPFRGPTDSGILSGVV